MNGLRWGMTWTFDINDKTPFNGALNLAICSLPSHVGMAVAGAAAPSGKAQVSGVGVGSAEVAWAADGTWEIEFRFDEHGNIGAAGDAVELWINDALILSGTSTLLQGPQTYFPMRIASYLPYHLTDPVTRAFDATASDWWMERWENALDLADFDPNDVNAYGYASSNGFTVWAPRAGDVLEYRTAEHTVQRPFNHAVSTGEGSPPYPAEPGYTRDLFMRRNYGDEWDRSVKATWVLGYEEDRVRVDQQHDLSCAEAAYYPYSATYGTEALVVGYAATPDLSPTYTVIADNLRAGGGIETLPSPESFVFALPDSRWAVGVFVPNGYKEWESTNKLAPVWNLTLDQSIPSGIGNLTAPQCWHGRRGRERAVVGYHGTDQAFYVLYRGAQGDEWAGPYLNVASATAYAPYILEFPNGVWEAGWYTPAGWVRYTADHPTKTWSVV